MSGRLVYKPGSPKKVARRRKVSTTIYMTVEQDEGLSKLSEATGVPMSEYIRRGIDIVLAEHSAKAGRP